MLGMFAAVLAIVVLVGLTVWSSRTRETKGNGDNVEAARRYGPGAGGV